MKKILIQIISSGRCPIWHWENQALVEAMRNDQRYQAMEISYAVNSLLSAKRNDAIIISVIHKKDVGVARHIIEDALINPRHFVFCETNLFLGKKKQLPNGKPAFEVTPLSRLTQQCMLEVIEMMLNEFQ